MGNQQAKAQKRPIQQFPFADTEKKSRTDWTAGVPLAPGKPVVQLSARTAPADENSVTDEINLVWGVPKDDGGYPITGYRIEMLDIQTNHWIEITFIEGFEPRCTLSNILYGIMYRFRVIAYNDAGPSEPGDPSDPVVIDVPGVQIAPYFVLMLNDTIALEHERVEFRIKVLGTPKPTIQWFKDDMEVFASDRLDIREEEDGGLVVVKEARLSDSGNIKCVATNILGRATSVGQLIIEAAPRLELPEVYNEGLIFRYDEVIRLKVPLIAKPAARITWFFDDEPICPSEDVTIETTENQTSLRIGAAKRWHCGEFRLLAQNENGEDSASILVTVTAPPSPPGKPVVIDITGTACTLRWEAVQDDGGADVKHYIVEYFRDVWDVWLKAKTTKECHVTIEDLIPGSRYKFRIKAENAYGISEESEESDPFDVAGNQQPDIRIQNSEEDWVGPEEAWSSNGHQIDLSMVKQGWESTDSTDEVNKSSEDMLKDFLRVKKFANRVSSIESDGLPSIASVDLGDDFSVSESSDLQRARKMYADLQAMSMESTGSTEDMPDLDAAAKQFYNEIRALSIETGGSIENILDNIGASSDSLASLIPREKRQELATFEMSLKQMIEEAKMLAESPGRSMESLLMAGGSQLDLSEPAEQDRSRTHKSSSNVSQPESIVSVVERRNLREVNMEDDFEPKPMSERGRPVERKMRPQPPMPRPPPTGSFELEEEEEVERSRRAEKAGAVLPLHQDSTEEEQAPPLEDLSPTQQDHVQQQQQEQQEQLTAVEREPPALPPQSEEKTAAPVAARAPGRRGQVINREPSVGSDRYEEIILETRKRSQSRGPNSRTASRTSSQVFDFRSSQSEFASVRGGSSRDLDVHMMRSSSRSSIQSGLPGLLNGSTTTSALDLDSRMAEKAQELFGGQSSGQQQRKMSAESVQTPRPPVVEKRPPTAAAAPKQPMVAAKVAYDANQNATAPCLPSVAPAMLGADSRPKLKQPVKPDPLVNMFPKNIPHWFVITYTYSVVLILILIIANSTPDGKLYIHFTAFWSLVLYFFLEDDQSNDILDSLVDRLIKK